VIAASNMMTGFFPAIKIGKEHYIEGGISYTTPITKVIRACKDMGATEISVDSITSFPDSDLPNVIKGGKTYEVLAKVALHVLSGWFHRDIDHSRISFPDAKIRAFFPKKRITWKPIRLQ